MTTAIGWNGVTFNDGSFQSKAAPLINKYDSGNVDVSSGFVTLNHGLGVIPTYCQVYYVVTVATKGWAAGDLIPISNGTENYNGDVAPAIAISSVYIKFRHTGTMMRTIGIDGSGRSTLGAGNLQIRVIAFA